MKRRPGPRSPAPPPARVTPPQRSTDWNKVADWYDNLVGDEGSEFHQQVIFPNALRLLAPRPAEKTLDVAAGQGAFCRLLAQQGASVTGVDASPDLIRLARQRNSVLSPQSSVLPIYLLADARDLASLFPPASFSAASCILAIQNIDKPAAVFENVSRLLTPSGRFLLVMMHPAFRSPRHTSWGWDNDVQYRRVDRYLLPRKEPIVTHPGKKNGEYTWTYHHPLQTYVKWLRNAGLLVETLEEWPSHKHSDSGPRAPAENTARSEIPMFLAIRALKIDRPSTLQSNE